jgi:hypothetical protein
MIDQTKHNALVNVNDVNIVVNHLQSQLVDETNTKQICSNNTPQLNLFRDTVRTSFDQFKNDVNCTDDKIADVDLDDPPISQSPMVHSKPID